MDTERTKHDSVVIKIWSLVQYVWKIRLKMKGSRKFLKVGYTIKNGEVKMGEKEDWEKKKKRRRGR